MIHDVDMCKKGPGFKIIRAHHSHIKMNDCKEKEDETTKKRKKLNLCADILQIQCIYKSVSELGIISENVCGCMFTSYSRFNELQVNNKQARQYNLCAKAHTTTYKYERRRRRRR